MRTGRHVARVATRCARARRDGVLVRDVWDFYLWLAGRLGFTLAKVNSRLVGQGRPCVFEAQGTPKTLWALSVPLMCIFGLEDVCA